MEIWLKAMAVWKVRELSFLLWVRKLCRCGDVLFLEVTPWTSEAYLTIFHPLLENVLQTFCSNFQEDSGTRSFDILITLKSAEIACDEIWTV